MNNYEENAMTEFIIKSVFWFPSFLPIFAQSPVCIEEN